LICLVLIGTNSAIKQSKAIDGDSLLYHLPIATNFLANFNLQPLTENPFSFYPANLHAILSLFMLVQIPWFVNLFNVFGIVLLFWSSYYLGNKIFEDKDRPYMFAVLTVTLVPVLRLFSTQMIEVWSLAILLPALSFLFVKPDTRQALAYSLLLGIFVGSKYNHLFMIVVISLVYANRIKYLFVNAISFAAFILPASFWYLRNLFVMGNPVYPASVRMLGLVGDTGIVFSTPGLDLWNNLSMVTKLFDALFSNYPVWMVLIPAMILVMKKDLENIKISVSGLGICLLYFVTPAFLNNVYHDLRYMLPGVCLMILVFLKHFWKTPGVVYGVTFLQILIAFNFFGYQPKVFVSSAILTLFLAKVSLKNKLSRKLDI